MAKSNNTSNTIQLPGNCYITEMKISPADLSMEKDWFFYYTFFDPEYTKGKRRQIRNMNSAKTFKNRMFEAKNAMESEMQLLLSGFNPIRETRTVVTPSDVLPTTDFATALWVAFEKVSGVPGTLKDIKATINGTLAAAKKLGFDRMQVKNVSRKYFKSIFDQCKKDNPRFTNNRQNVYRKWLKKLFDELIEMEAVESNPLVFIKKEKIIKKDRRLPTDEERKLINDYLKKEHYYFWRAIQVFFASGSRETEIMAIQKKHVDLKSQRCLYTVKKGRETREVWRPITDSALPFWLEILSEAKDEDFLFSENLQPGAKQLKTEALSRRWQRHIKGTAPAKKGYKKKDTGCLHIPVDLYSLKHLNTTEIMDALDKEYNPVKDVAKLTGHTSEAMIIKIYDKNNKERKDDKIKRVGGTF